MWNDEAGWVACPNLLTRAQVETILSDIDGLAARDPADRALGDKPVAGTRHLNELAERSPAVAEVVNDAVLDGLITEILGSGQRSLDASYRCPQPGFGGQQLHADDLPKYDAGPSRVATAIVALVDFTVNNGATRVVPGSHRRPDLQRQAGQLADHPDQLHLTGTAGSAFVFSGHLLHSGTRNDSDQERPALQLVWRTAGHQLGG